MADLADADAASRWEDPPRNAAGVSAPVLSVDGFEGPLDFLLEMARAQKIDLARLSIVALVEAFAGALETALTGPGASSLARWGDWLVMAATLTQLRFRLLLPAEAPEAKAALSEAEALRRQLVGREEMRAAADWLERRPQLGREVFPRGQPEGRPTSRGADITDLLRACLKLLEVPAELAAVYRPRPPAFWRVSQAIGRIEAMLSEQPEGAGHTAFLAAIATDGAYRERQCRAAVASTLVAGLELARQGGVVLWQELDWGEISVRAKMSQRGTAFRRRRPKVRILSVAPVGHHPTILRLTGRYSRGRTLDTNVHDATILPELPRADEICVWSDRAYRGKPNSSASMRRVPRISSIAGAALAD